MDSLKFILLSAIFMAMAFSCKEAGPPDDDGSTPDGCPVTYVRLPSVPVYSGDRVCVIGTGFSSDASYYLESTAAPDNTEILTDVTVTPSGIEFTARVTAGGYMLVVEQDGRWELGTITVEMREIEAVIGSVPEYCLPGGSFTVSGTGFSSSSAMVLEDPETGLRTALATESGTGKLTASVPQDAPRGKSTLILLQDGAEMIISDRFFITTEKKLAGMKYTLTAGTSEGPVWEISVTRNGNGDITECEPYSLVINENGDSGTGLDFIASDEDKANGYSDFTLAVDAVSEHVVSASFGTGETDPDTGKDILKTFTWDYSGDYLSYIVTPKNTGRIAVTDEGNISLEDFWVDCSYGDPSLVNNPFAADFTLSVLATNDLILQAAIMFGLTGTASDMLPDSFSSAPVSYTFDEEGYVTGASYKDPLDSYDVILEYVYR